MEIKLQPKDNFYFSDCGLIGGQRGGLHKKKIYKKRGNYKVKM